MKSEPTTIPSNWQDRRLERGLFAGVFFAVLAAHLMVWLVRFGNAPVFEISDILPLAAFLGTMVLTHLVFTATGFRGDTRLAPAAFFLVGLGLLTRFRMGLREFEGASFAHPASLAFPLGVTAFLGVTLACRKGRYRALERAALPALALAAAVFGLILATGERFRGGVYMRGNFNPSEITKVLLPLFLAGFFAARREAWSRAAWGFPRPPLKSLLLFVALWSVPTILVLLQRDLGLLILLNGLLIGILFFATGRAAYPLVGLALAVGTGYWLFQHVPHVTQRFLAWQHPFGDPTGRSWQTLQALTALYNGGMWGTGLGVGSPHAIPIASSDFIYAAIGEELGFAGTGVVLAFFLVMLERGLAASWSAKTSFGFLLGTGLCTALMLQVLLNVGGVVKAIPLTGITLPFLSQGGSSLIASFITLGLLLAISEDGEDTRLT
jgi:peptidoglycan glycosyltransferase